MRSLASLLGILILAGLVILQTTIFSYLRLLNGTVDLVLLTVVAWALQKRVNTAWHWCIIGGLMIELASALPFGVSILGYALAIGLALLLRQRVWQVPIMAMFVVIFLSTFITQGLAYIALRLMGDPIAGIQALNLVIIPGVVLNLLFVIPVYTVISDLAGLVHPEELVV